MMIELAYRAAKSASYQEAEDFFYRINKIRVNDDTIRQVVNYMGNIVYMEDCRRASMAENFDESESSRDDIKGSVLYIMADGAALNTRTKDTDGSSWKENKLAVVFTDGDMYYWKSKDGKKSTGLTDANIFHLLVLPMNLSIICLRSQGETVMEN